MPPFNNPAQPKRPVAVLGAGSWGTALALVLARNTREVNLWDRDPNLIEHIQAAQANPRYLPGVSLPSLIKAYRDLREAISAAQDIVIAVPSHAFSPLLEAIKPFLTSQHRLVWATKGLESETGCFLHEVVESALGARAYGVLSGPSFAKEVALGLPTAVNIAAHDPQFAADLKHAFNQDNFKVSLSEDMIGLQLGGVFKNVLAVAVGLSDGAHLGANTRAALMTQGLFEMRQLGVAVGAKSETLLGLAGIGDALLTCMDNQSRNRRFGMALGEGKSKAEALEQVGQVVEAVYNVEQLCALAQKHLVELPIAKQVFRVINGEIPPRVAITELFKQVP